MFSTGCCPWRAAQEAAPPFLLEKAPPGSAQQGSSLVISECVTLWLPHRSHLQSSTDPKFLPAPSSQGNQQLLKLLLLTGHTHRGAAQALFSSPTLQGIPATPQGVLRVLGTVTVTHRAQGQARSDSADADGTKPIKSRLKPCPIQAWTGCQ